MLAGVIAETCSVEASVAGSAPISFM